MPKLSVDMLKAACPLPFTVVGPESTLAPSLNVTVPWVTALPPEVTVAVKVTGCPKAEGPEGEATTLVAVTAVEEVATEVGGTEVAVPRSRTAAIRGPPIPSRHGVSASRVSCCSKC